MLYVLVIVFAILLVSLDDSVKAHVQKYYKQACDEAPKSKEKTPHKAIVKALNAESQHGNRCDENQHIGEFDAALVGFGEVFASLFIVLLD